MTCKYCNEEFGLASVQIGAGDGTGQLFAHKHCYDLIQLGKECAVHITGDVEDATDIESISLAMRAIRECIDYGLALNNLNIEFLYKLEDIRRHGKTTESSAQYPVR